MKNIIKNMPKDVKQIAASLVVSVSLIAGSLFTLYSYVNSTVSNTEKDAQVIASEVESVETE